MGQLNQFTGGSDVSWVTKCYPLFTVIVTRQSLYLQAYLHLSAFWKNMFISRVRVYCAMNRICNTNVS